MAPPAKLFLLPLAAIAHWIAFRPPVPPPSQADRVNKRTLFEKSPRAMAATTQIISAACLMLETATIFALYLRDTPGLHIPLIFCPSSPSLQNMSAMSPLLLAGLATMYASAMIRVWCYKALGRLFTYEITIRPGHKLVTSGPYAYVRHPGYTANIMMLTSTAVVCLCRGSYIDECGLMSTPLRWFVRVWVTCLAYWDLSFFRRGRIEDDGLRKEFGSQWDKYRHSVQCRYIPGLV